MIVTDIRMENYLLRVITLYVILLLKSCLPLSRLRRPGTCFSRDVDIERQFLRKGGSDDLHITSLVM